MEKATIIDACAHINDEIYLKLCSTNRTFIITIDDVINTVCPGNDIRINYKTYVDCTKIECAVLKKIVESKK